MLLVGACVSEPLIDKNYIAISFPFVFPSIMNGFFELKIFYLCELYVHILCFYLLNKKIKKNGGGLSLSL